MVLRMVAVCHLGFLKFNFFYLLEVKRPILHHHTKFRKDQSNCCGDIAIFVIFKMAAAAILDFQKFQNFIKIGHWSHGCRDMAILRFSKWRPSAILDL